MLCDVCVYAFVGMSAGTCVPWGMCGCMRTILGFSPHLPSCLKQDLLVCLCICQTNWPESFCVSPVFVCHLASGFLALQIHQAMCGLWGFKSSVYFLREQFTKSATALTLLSLLKVSLTSEVQQEVYTTW